MNRREFIHLITEMDNCTKKEADHVINTFTQAVSKALSEGTDISLIGFGAFSVAKVAARKGRNPKTGAEIQIPAYKQVKFKAGQKLKDACNNK